MLIRNREYIWLLLLGSIFLITITAAFGQDQRYAQEAEKRIDNYARQIKDIEKHMDMSEVNQWYLLELKLDRLICRRHLNAYLNGEDRKELDAAINQLSHDMENTPPAFRTVKQ